MNNHATVQSSAPVSAASLLQVSGALIAIIALILAAAWLVKRLGFAPKRTGVNGLKISASASLGARELLTMYIVTAFALNYSTQNMGLPRELFLNIGLLVGGLSCLTIPCFAWLADRFGRRRVYITGALIGTLSAFPFFMALEAQSIFWIVFFSIMLANIAHDMVVCVQQPMFTEMFGASYRYSGAGVGYQVASVVGGGFTPFIAAALITYFAGNWHSVAIYLLAGCLISAMTALLMKDSQRA